MRFSVEKTKVMLFSRRRKFRVPSLRMQGASLEFVDGFKYLGVMVNRKLSWTGHLRAKIQQCKW